MFSPPTTCARCSTTHSHDSTAGTWTYHYADHAWFCEMCEDNLRSPKPPVGTDWIATELRKLNTRELVTDLIFVVVVIALITLISCWIAF